MIQVDLLRLPKYEADGPGQPVLLGGEVQQSVVFGKVLELLGGKGGFGGCGNAGAEQIGKHYF